MLFPLPSLSDENDHSFDGISDLVHWFQVRKKFFTGQVGKDLLGGAGWGVESAFPLLFVNWITLGSFQLISPNKSPVIISALGVTYGRWKGKCECSYACSVLLSSVFQDWTDAWYWC